MSAILPPIYKKDCAGSNRDEECSSKGGVWNVKGRVRILKGGRRKDRGKNEEGDNRVGKDMQREKDFNSGIK